MKGLPALLGSLGLIGVLFGLLSFLFSAFAPIDPFWIGANLALGVVLLGVAAVLSVDTLRERMGSGEARRAGKFGTSAILTTMLSIAILGMLGYTAELFPRRWDWSEAKVHSLSDQSVKLLQGLDRDVHVTAIFGPIELPYVREFLDRYAYVSDSFTVDYVDPNAKPHVLEQLGILPEELGEGLIHLQFGDDSVRVTELSEEHITNAMVKLSRTGTKQVYFLEGHNERPMDGAADRKEGFQRAAEALRNENYQVETLLLAARGDVPEDADVVIVAGATRPLLREESQALTRYLARGGAVMVLVDPRAKTDLVDRVREWGVNVGEDLVVDRKLALFGQPTSPFAESYDTNHEITRDLRETTMFYVARSVQSDPDSDGQFTELVFTGQESWAERDVDLYYRTSRAQLDEGDLRGPVSIAVAGIPAVDRDGAAEGDVEGDPIEPRLVVFGDSDFASNALIERYRNRDLFVNSVNWLLGDVEAISIRPARSRASRFQLTQGQFATIRTLSLFVLPEAIAVLGVITWWRRRHPGGA